MSRPPNPVRYEKKPMGVEDVQARASDRAGERALRRSGSLPNAPPGTPGKSDRGQQLQEAGERQPHHVEVVAPDRGHERRARPLDGVAAGTAVPFPRPHVALEGRAVESPERHLRGLHRGGDDLAVPSQRDAAHHQVGAARQAAQERGRLRRVGGLAQDVAVQRDVRVGPEDQFSGDRERLAARVLLRDPRGVAPRLLRDARDPDLERDPGLLEDRPPLRRGGGEDQARSGKNSFASRSADSGESEPWTMFWPTSTAKSPRIEPGAASSGFVAPMTWRAATTACSPSSTIATSGPEVMNDTSSPKNGLPSCSA